VEAVELLFVFAVDVVDLLDGERFQGLNTETVLREHRLDVHGDESCSQRKRFLAVFVFQELNLRLHVERAAVRFGHLPSAIPVEVRLSPEIGRGAGGVIFPEFVKSQQAEFRRPYGARFLRELRKRVRKQQASSFRIM